MKESDKSGDLVKDLRAAFLGAVVFKHADYATRDVPDISITWHGKTLWLEVKLNKDLSHVHSLTIADFQKIAEQQKSQLHTATKLAKVGLCWYAIFSKGYQHVHLWHPLINVNKKFPTRQAFVSYLKENWNSLA